MPVSALVAKPTTSLKPQPKKVDMGHLVGRGLSTPQDAQAPPPPAATTPPRDVAVHITKTADEVLRGAGVLKSTDRPAPPLLKRIHQEAAVTAAVLGDPGDERLERGNTPGLPRRGVGFDGSLRRRGMRPTQRGHDQVERMVQANPVFSMTNPQRVSLPNESVQRGPMYYDQISKTCIVPPFEQSPDNPGHLSPAHRLDAPPLRGEMGRGAWKRWTPPYRAHHAWKRPWQDQQDRSDDAARHHAGDAAKGSAKAIAQDRLNDSVPALSRPESVQGESVHRMGDTWFKDVGHRHVASYFDTPLWSRAKEGIVTPYWMQPDVMTHSSSWGFPFRDLGTSSLQRRTCAQHRATAPSTSSTDSNIDPRLLRSLDNKELRHYLARAQVWSSEPLASCTRPDLIGLARQHMGKIQEIKKDESFKACKKYGKPGSVADKYRNALRHSDTVEVMEITRASPKSKGAVNVRSEGVGDPGGEPGEGELIRDVEAAQMELEKSIEAVAKAKRKSELARIRLALANGDPAASLSLPHGGTGTGQRSPSGPPDVFSLDQEEGIEWAIMCCGCADVTVCVWMTVCVWSAVVPCCTHTDSTDIARFTSQKTCCPRRGYTAARVLRRA